MLPRIFEFLGAALLMELTPGPNMSWLALLTLREGRMAGLQAVAGISLGLLLLGLITSLGVAELLASQPQIAALLKGAGVIYMLYLAVEAWMKSPPTDGSHAGRHFWRGVAVNLLNPKAAAVFVTVIPTFAGAAQRNAGSMAAFSVIYVLIATLVHASIVGFSGAFHPLVVDASRERALRRIFAVLLAAVAAWMVTI